jgi:hypothetical protein
MTYSTGGLIQAADYNGFANNTANANVNSVWGNGAGDFGYGQSTTLSVVSLGGTVTATQWADLNSRITSIANHSNTAITSRTSPSAGNIISVLANVNTDITNCATNRGNAVSSGTQYVQWTGNIAKLTGTGSGTSSWTITFTHTITFANNQAFRNFFNAGGILRWQTAKSSTGQVADPEWNAMATSQGGNIFLTGRVNNTTNTIAGAAYTGTTRQGGSATANILANTTGIYNLTTTSTNLFRFFSPNSPYTTQSIQLAGNVNSNSAPTVVTLVTTWTDPGGGSFSSAITGGTDTASPFSTFGTAPATLVTYFPPSTTFLTNTWGTPTIAATVA